MLLVLSTSYLLSHKNIWFRRPIFVCTLNKGNSTLAKQTRIIYLRTYFDKVYLCKKEYSRNKNRLELLIFPIITYLVCIQVSIYLRFSKSGFENKCSQNHFWFSPITWKWQLFCRIRSRNIQKYTPLPQLFPEPAPDQLVFFWVRRIYLPFPWC